MHTSIERLYCILEGLSIYTIFVIIDVWHSAVRCMKKELLMKSVKQMAIRLCVAGLLATSVSLGTAASNSAQAAVAVASNKALKIVDQGVFSAGGTVLQSPGVFDPTNQWEANGAGQTLHVDHANVLYQIPDKAKEAPMIFLHGYGQSRMGWMSTPDGRPGWSNFFLHKGHAVFLVDQPRRGEAGNTSVPGIITNKTLDQRWYTQFRIGRWENGRSVTYEGSQFPNNDRSVDQFFRQMTPDTAMKSDMGADFDPVVVGKALAVTIDEVVARTGKKPIVVTHSQGGGPGWIAAEYTNNIAGIIAIEPGNPPAKDSDAYKAIDEKKIPVVFYYGDYIDNGDPTISATAFWQGRRDNAIKFADELNANGGNVRVVDLPKEGIYGNEHFIFQDKNSDEVAQHVENWIKKNVKVENVGPSKN